MTQISSQEKLIFTKHLSVMLKAGITITQALDSLAKDATNPKLRQLITSLYTQIESGQSLSQALRLFPQVFDPIYLNLITIGEESGTLDSTLRYLSLQLAKLKDLRQKIQGALLYPTLVLGLMFTIGIGLSIFILPQLVEFFSAFDTNLPLSTRILLSFANLMKYHGLTLLISLIIVILGFNLIIKFNPIKRIWNRFIFHLPLFGKFIHLSSMAILSRNMSVLLSSGVPLSRGLTILSSTEPNLYLQSNLDQLSHHLKSGKSLSETIKSYHLTIFPSLFTKMVAVGESTGKLDEMLSYLADYYESDIEVASKNLTTTLEPILLIIVGLMVAFLALAIIGPIYQITGSIGG